MCNTFVHLYRLSILILHLSRDIHMAIAQNQIDLHLSFRDHKVSHVDFSETATIRNDEKRGKRKKIYWTRYDWCGADRKHFLLFRWCVFDTTMCDVVDHEVYACGRVNLFNVNRWSFKECYYCVEAELFYVEKLSRIECKLVGKRWEAMKTAQKSETTGILTVGNVVKLGKIEEGSESDFE